MKNIFAPYPSVFYQIVLLFVIEQICFSAISYGMFSPMDYIDGGADYSAGEVLSSVFVFVSLLYILSGFLVDKFKDVRRGFRIGIGIMAAGFAMTIWGISNLPQYALATGFLYVGHGIFYILVLRHVGLFFPIANDWKDNAFLILLLTPVVVVFALMILVVLLFSNYIMVILGNPLIVNGIVGASFLLLFILLEKYKDIGFSVEEREEEEVIEKSEEEEFAQIHESTRVKLIMLGIVLTATVFTFITSNLSRLGSPSGIFDSDLTSYLFESSIGYQIVPFTSVVIIVVIGYFLIRFANDYSTHFQKIKWFVIVLLGMVFLEILAMAIDFYLLDTFLETGYSYAYNFILFPFLISILTHVNLDRQVGLWIGLLIGIPDFFEHVLSFMFNEKTAYYFSFLSVLLLIIFLVWLRENKDFLEKQLALNEPNRVDNDEEDGIDILEHFIEE